MNDIILNNIYSLEEIKKFYNNLSKEKDFINNPLSFPLEYVVGIRKNNELIGIGGLKNYYRCFKFSFYIVKEEYQGKGVANDITNNIVNYCRTKKYGCFFASAHKNNIRAINAYVGQGYKIIYRRGNYLRMIFCLDWKGFLCKKIAPLLFFIYFIFNNEW